MAMSKGCTIALIAVGIVVVLIVVLIFVIMANRDKLVDFSVNVLTNSLETEILKNIPDGYTSDSVHQVFVDFKAAVKNGQIKPDRLQEVAGIIQVVLADKTVTKEEGALVLGKVKEAMNAQPSESPDSLHEIDRAVPDSV